MTTRGNESRTHSSLYESSFIVPHDPDESKAGDEFDFGTRRSPTDITNNDYVPGSETVPVGNDTFLIPLPSSANASSRGSIASHSERPSLDTLLRVGGISNPAALVPLPESVATINNHSHQASLNSDSGRSVRTSSLDALEETNRCDLVSARTDAQTRSGYLRKPSERTLDDLEITEVLESPPSPPPFASRVHDRTTAQNASDSSQQGLYRQTIKALSTHLPHLQHTLQKTRHHGINIKWYDYIDGLLVSTPLRFQTPDFRRTSKHYKNKFRRALKDDIPEDVNLRFIVVEDLSVELIEILGSTFGISPEFFEEHLINSGWHDGTYQDREADTWITRGMEKSYTSIRWYRPTMPKFAQPNSADDRIKLLKPENPLLVWTEAVSNESVTMGRVKHKASPTTNILRQDWSLGTNAEKVAPLLSPSAWEERATVWSKHLEGCHVVVLLLDPLPVLKDHVEGAAAALESLGHYKIATRPTVSSSAAVDARGANHIDESKVHRSPALLKIRTFAKAPRKLWSKLMSYVAPSLSSPSAHDAREFVGAEEGLPPVTEVPEQAEADEKERTESIALQPWEYCLFANVLRRGPPINYNLLVSSDNMHNLEHPLVGTNSTAADLCQWVQHRQHRQLSAQARFGPLDFLFDIISGDTLELIHLMDLALSEIGHDILDDSVIQQRLLHWRHLIEKFDITLRQLQKSLIQFAGFLTPTQMAKSSVQPNKPTGSVPLNILLQDSLKHLSELQQRTSKSYKSLMANMSIINSKRGIAEAESVTKLTELAFFFIPLTFSASIFSMQVRELNPTRVSVSAFFILAIIITASSYGLRLFIRSASVIRLRKRCLDQVRSDAELTPGTPIPTRVFIICLWQRIWIFMVIASLFIVLPIALLAVLWTRDINNGYKAMLTVLILVFFLAAYYMRSRVVLPD
ncbi:MAG: hypothetical protein Q9187_005311 [Circinaria calcarea]